MNEFEKTYFEEEDEIPEQEQNTENAKGQRKTGRMYRRKKDRKAFRDAKEISSYGSNPFRGQVDPKTGKYMKNSSNSGKKAFWKTKSNRTVRRADEVAGKGNSYKKVGDIKWDTL